MTNGANLYCSKIEDGILTDESPVVIAYNRELNSAGYKTDVDDIPQCTIILQLPEKVDSSTQKQDLIVSENKVGGITLYTFVAVLELTIANKRYATTEQSYDVSSALHRFANKQNKKLL